MREVPQEPGANADGDVTQAQRGLGVAGDTIGSYRLLERLGEGGMGEVWWAEQQRPVRRYVALKVIKAGMDTSQVIARFEAERQALAVMDHPGIAKVFDAGSTPQGRPYFAMEYVRGDSLTTYCDRQRLTIPERLELFVQVCEGVQHAHQKGIIHRDLKPSNILVTTQDDRPVPKIIDFGVAKAVSQPLTEHTLYTSLTGLIGTPEYMSPEQADRGGVDIDTRTDVYALGVVLYELLTGMLPFDRGVFRDQSVDQIRKAIREVDPSRPSTRVSHAEPDSSAAVNRRLETGRFAGLLRGDLDWITMRALEKDRRRRYGSASDLAADIRRYLTHQPVLAGPPSGIYRSRKFVRRHRLGMSVVATLAVMLLLFALTMAVQARRIARERDRANTEAHRANLEAAAARQVSDFLVGLFKVSDPGEARGATLTARQILDKGARDIETTLAAQPELQARLQLTIGTVYIGLGAYAAAEPLLNLAAATTGRVLGDTHADTVNARHALANLYWYQDRFMEAEPLYRSVIETRRTQLGDDHALTLRANFDLASLYAADNRLSEAEPLMQSTFERQRRLLGEEHEDTLDSMGNLASLYYRQKRYAAAEPLSRKVFDLKRRKWGAQHPETLTSMHNLATVYDRLERWSEAEELYARTIAAKRHVQGETHISTILTTARLVGMYVRQKRYPEAEAQLRTTAVTLSALPNADPRATVMVSQAFVSLYEAWGRPAKADEWRTKLPK